MIEIIEFDDEILW